MSTLELARKHQLSVLEAEELHLLLLEVRPLKFTRSKQLSNYIVQNRLGYKYPTIAGIVRMREDSNEWNFPGGFPENIYAIICRELGLENQKSKAKPVGFTPFGGK